MKYLLTLWWMFIPFFSDAQNLLSNASFEIHTSCPTAANQVDSVIDWFAVSQSPDYCNSCTSVPEFSVPSNLFGYQNAHSGNAYCGMLCYYSTPNYREYIGTHTISPLEVGQKYFVSFWLSLSGGSAIGATEGCNKFGCKVSTVPFLFNNTLPDNQAIFYSDSIIIDTSNWTFIQGSFIADSAYNYLALGNFFDDDHTDTLSLSGNTMHAYYFIDDVCLSRDSISCDRLENVDDFIYADNIVITPNPATSFFSLSLKTEMTSIRIVNTLGEEIYSENYNQLPFYFKQFKTDSWAKGIYFLEIEVEGQIFQRKIIIQ